MSDEMLATELSRLLAEAQRAHRLPSVEAAVALDGLMVWSSVSGDATVGTHYRIGSITKTFTAALVLLLVDDGRLELDDRIDRYLPGTPLGRATVRHLLCHTGGVPREAPGPMWQTFEGPDRTALLASLYEAAPVAGPGERWHYSNLGYALLGLVAEHATGEVGTCRELITDRLLRPLKLAATNWEPLEPAAQGFRVDPYQDVAHAEHEMDQGAIGVAGQLWSTTEDLLVWADALSGHRPDVLPHRVVDRMHTLHTMVDVDQWRQAWGLGLILTRQGERVIAGHTGAMPGFSASLALQRSSRLAVAVLTNATRASGIDALSTALLERAVEHGRRIVQPWQPTSSCPPGLAGVLGRWWSEGDEVVMTWREGRLQAHLSRCPTVTSVFAEVQPDVWVVSEGREYGEHLHINRDADGEVTGLVWATYPYTRHPS